jgi:hypothetical protein
MTNILILASLIWASALLSVKADSAELDNVSSGDSVVARMGGVELHAEDVRKLLEAQSPEMKLHIEFGSLALERLIRKELVRRAILQQAHEKEWDKRSEIIQKMEVAKEQVIVSTYVNSLTRPPANYPSEDEIRSAYKGGKDTFKLPSQYQATQIYVAPSVESGRKNVESVQSKITDTTEKINNKTDESSAPAKISQEQLQNAEQHKEIVLRNAVLARSEVHDSVTAMKTGEVSTTIRASPDWRIEMKPATVKELAEVREGIVQTLRWHKALENEAKYLEEFGSSSSVELNRELLDQVLIKH